MIIFISPRHQPTYILRTMQRDARMPEWKCHTLQWLLRARRLPAATYIFLLVDRLDHGERRLAGQFYRHINSLGSGWRALNDPSLAMGRFRLLRSLHEAGINDFNAYLVAEGIKPASFPVFVRRNSINLPPLTGLLDSQAELDSEVDRLVNLGEVPEDLIIIEYCAAPIRGNTFRKISEYRLGGQYIPSPSMFRDNWIVKYSPTIEVPDELLAQEAEFMEQNPFAEIAKRVFEIAHIEYGRADIGMVNGRPQTYEINFNPSLITQREIPNSNETLRRLWKLSEDKFFTALHAVDETVSGSQRSLATDELTAFRLRFWRNYAPQRF